MALSYCVDFVENALFKNSALRHSNLPLLFDELLMDKRDSDCFISRRLVYRYSDTVLTHQSLVTVGYVTT